MVQARDGRIARRIPAPVRAVIGGDPPGSRPCPTCPCRMAVQMPPPNCVRA
ncbi:hypothetical protein BUH_2430 [Burkholderia pseudomallei Pakistan 9]|nr:hypothetical protein BUH_2430 [Burkholderia pseudomallei Pakistan 9]